MKFERYFTSELWQDISERGYSGFRAFEATQFEELVFFDQNIQEWCVAKDTLLIQIPISVMMLESVVNLYQTVLPTITQRMVERLKARTVTFSKPHENDAVGAAIFYLAQRFHSDADAENDPIVEQVIGFLNGQAMKTETMVQHRLFELKDKMTKENSELFFQSVIKNLKKLGFGAITIHFQQSVPIEENKRGSIAYFRRCERLGFILRRWADWTVQGEVKGVLTLATFETAIWKDVFTYETPVRDRIEPIRDREIRPLRYNKLPYAHPAFQDESMVEQQTRSASWDAQSIISREVINTLRLGVVPKSEVREMTAGMTELEAFVQQQIRGDQSQIHVHGVWGAYGSGKSHSMNVLRGLLEQQGWVSVMIELNGERISWKNPLILIYIWKALPMRLWDYWLMARQWYGAEAKQKLIAIDPRIYAFWHAFDFLATQDIAIIKEWVPRLEERVIGSGSAWQDFEHAKWKSLNPPVKLEEIKGWVGTTAVDQPQQFKVALEAICHLVKLAGYQGLWIGLDENDHDLRKMEKKDLLFTLNLINAIAAVKAPCIITLGMVPENETSKRGLGIVGGSIYATLVRLIDSKMGTHLRLREMTHSERNELTEFISKHYVRAYPNGQINETQLKNRALQLVKAYEREFQQIGNHGSSARLFIKYIVDCLDAFMGPN